MWKTLLPLLMLTTKVQVSVGDLLMDAISAFVDVKSIAGDTRTMLQLADEMAQNKTTEPFDDTFPLSSHELGLLFQLYDKCGTDKSLALRTWCTGVPLNGTNIDGDQLCPPGVRTHPCTGRVLDVAKDKEQIEFLWPWQGIKCDVFTDPTTITNIYLPGQGLKCRLQDLDFSYMVSLEQLDLSQNELNGPFPSWLGNMTLLRFLNLRENQLQSRLPLSFGDNIAIEVIDLANNRLTAQSLSFFKIFKRLRYLDLSNNLFNLSLPSGFFAGEYLEHLNLSRNMFHGPLPTLPSLKHLESFDVSHNEFEGRLPTGMGLWGRMDSNDPAEDPITEVLDFSFNRFTGSIPPLLNQSSLLRFAVQNNQLGGVVPRLPISLFTSNTPRLFVGNKFLCPLPQLTPTPEEYGNLRCLCKNGRKSNPRSLDGGITGVATNGEVPAALAFTECRVCPRGTYSNATTEFQCTKCPVGHVPNLTMSLGDIDGATDCAACEAGTYANTTGSSQCAMCPQGTIASESGQSRCTKCFPGYYMDEEGGVKCKLCPPGTASSQDGSTSCTPCRPGTYSAYSGEFTCFPCSRGQFQDQEGATSCLECPVGHVALRPGQPKCIACPVGMFFEKDTKTCIQCPPNTFADTEAQIECQLCAVGTAADDYGNSKCEPPSKPGHGRFCGPEIECSPGQFNNGSFVGCQACPWGTFANESKSEECKPCEPGSFSDVVGATGCRLAPTGSFVDEFGAWRPRRCPPGHFADSQGSPACKPCPNDTFSILGGRAQCEPIVDGAVMQPVMWPHAELRIIGVATANLQSNTTLQDELQNAWRLALMMSGISNVETYILDVAVDGTSPLSGRTKVDIVLEELPPPRVRKRASDLISKAKDAFTNVSEAFDETTESASQLFNRRSGKSEMDCAHPTNGNLSQVIPDKKFKRALSRQLAMTPSLRRAASLLTVRLLPSPFRSTRAVRCPRGSFFTMDSGTRRCVPCPVGTHADEEGLIGTCKPCPVRHFADEEGMDNCVECPWGSGAMSGAVACEKCAFFSRTCGEFWNNVVFAAVIGVAVGLTAWQRAREMWSGRRGVQQQSEDAALVASIRAFGRVPWQANP